MIGKRSWSTSPPSNETTGRRFVRRAARESPPKGVDFEPINLESAMRTCPVCGHELAERQCEPSCPRPGPGHFLSCAGFY